MSLTGHGIDRFEAVLSRGASLAQGGDPSAPLQRLSSASRVLGAALLLAAGTASRIPGIPALIVLLCCVGALAGRIGVGGYLRTCFLLIAVFVVPVALLGSLSCFTPGAPALELGPLVLTETGLRSALLMSLRALAAVAVTTLLVRSAGLRGIVEGMRLLRVPESLLMVLQMTFAHIQLLGRTAQNMVLGMRARSVEPPGVRQAWRTAGAQGLVLLQRSVASSREVHAAMLARGFSGRFVQAGGPPAGWKAADAALLLGTLALLVAALVLQGG